MCCLYETYKTLSTSFWVKRSHGYSCNRNRLGKENQNFFVVSILIHNFAFNHWQMTSVEAAGETFEEI
jgi:hypothetical protein